MNDAKNYPVEDSDNELIRRIDAAVGEAKMNGEWRRSSQRVSFYSFNRTPVLQIKLSRRIFQWKILLINDVQMV